MFSRERATRATRCVNGAGHPLCLRHAPDRRSATDGTSMTKKKTSAAKRAESSKTPRSEPRPPPATSSDAPAPAKSGGSSKSGGPDGRAPRTDSRRQSKDASLDAVRERHEGAELTTDQGVPIP